MMEREEHMKVGLKERGRGYVDWILSVNKDYPQALVHMTRNHRFLNRRGIS